MEIRKGLIIDSPHIDNILSGKKTWEMRSSGTKQRGTIALIRKGSGLVFGAVDLVDSIGPLNSDQMLANASRHLISPDRIRSGAVAKWKHAWVVSNVRSLQRPVAYRHPPGAVIWVNLDDDVARSIGQQVT